MLCKNTKLPRETGSFEDCVRALLIEPTFVGLVRSTRTSLSIESDLFAALGRLQQATRYMGRKPFVEVAMGIGLAEPQKSKEHILLMNRLGIEQHPASYSKHKSSRHALQKWSGQREKVTE